MGLSNAASRARNYDQTINKNQGGGMKKAGFPYLVGRTAWNSIFITGSSTTTSRCMSLKCMQFTANPNVKPSRPIDSRPNSYW